MNLIKRNKTHILIKVKFKCGTESFKAITAIGLLPFIRNSTITKPVIPSINKEIILHHQKQVNSV